MNFPGHFSRSQHTSNTRHNQAYSAKQQRNSNRYNQKVNSDRAKHDKKAQKLVQETPQLIRGAPGAQAIPAEVAVRAVAILQTDELLRNIPEIPAHGLLGQ